MSAPAFNSVNALNGDVADRPNRFFGALSEADSFCRELDTVHELRARVDELTAERNDLEGQLADARETHRLLLESIAHLNREVTKLEGLLAELTAANQWLDGMVTAIAAERDTARAEASAWRNAGDAR